MKKHETNDINRDWRDLCKAARRANDNEMKETAEWARIFANEDRQSMRAALAVLAGFLDEPDMLRRIADKLEAIQPQVLFTSDDDAPSRSKRGWWTPEREAFLKRHYCHGTLTSQEIANSLGTTRGAVTARAALYGGKATPKLRVVG